MSAAFSVFKLSVQSVRQLQQHKIEVSFKTHLFHKSFPP